MSTRYPLSHQCRVTLRRLGPTTAVVVEGALDWRTAPSVERAVNFALPARRLLLDLRHAERIDAAGTSLAVEAYLKCEQSHTPMAVAVADRPEVEVLDRVGLPDLAAVLTSDADVDDWVAAR